MEDKNCKLLFQYLKGILYEPESGELDVQELDEPYRKMGQGLQYLHQAVREMLDYSADLARGNLSCEVPGKENFLCENLKNIHANLNHLTWQAKQVAAGDYSQAVSYLGEFSEAFNTMTQQLKEREMSLEQEANKEKSLAKWFSQQATEDALTGIWNRRYFSQRMEKLLAEGKPFTLCYMDLDNLKFVNDRYGHLEGDNYLCSFVQTVKEHIRENDVFARLGGDEFCILFFGCLKATVTDKMEKLRASFAGVGGEKYTASFSYGITEIRDNPENLSVSRILEQADRIMYEYKRLHKKERA